MGKFTPGHLSSNNELKINDVPVSEGQFIYSEKHGMTFIDYLNKRHTHGNILTGIYNDSGYVDFTTSTLDVILQSIVENGFVNDGQYIKTADSVYIYRKFKNNNFIIKNDDSGVNISKNEVGYIINLPEYSTEDKVNMDLLVFISNNTDKKLYLLKVIDNVLSLDDCQDLDGTFNKDTFELSIINNEGLFLLSSNSDTEINLQVISHSVSSSGNSKNEGFYVIKNN